MTDPADPTEPAGAAPDLAAIAADLSDSVAALSTANALGLPDLIARINLLKARIDELEAKVRSEIEQPLPPE